MTLFDLKQAVNRYQSVPETMENPGANAVLAALSDALRASLRDHGRDSAALPNGMTPVEAVCQMYETILLSGGKDGYWGPADAGKSYLFKVSYFDNDSYPQDSGGALADPILWLLIRSCALYELSSGGALKNCPVDIDPGLLFLSTMYFWNYIDEYDPLYDGELDLKTMNLPPTRKFRKRDLDDDDWTELFYSESHMP